MKIGLLATGSELATGDTINSNTAKIAQKLTDLGYSISAHIIVGDDKAEMISGINYLKQLSSIIIITGGLGPTTDDITRFALAEIINLPLFEHEPSWKNIVARLNKFNVPVTENNRQQALFPKDAKIFHNPNGTANGCRVFDLNSFCYYLLPGPPQECLAMLNESLIPDLAENFPIKHQLFKRRWLLFNVSESFIGEALQKVLASHDYVLAGYRVDYPYLEFKISCEQEKISEDWLNPLENLLQPFLIDSEHLPASILLSRKIAQTQAKILINDYATAGNLQRALLNHGNYNFLQFNQDDGQDSYKTKVTIQGLTEYWEQADELKETWVELSIETNNQSENNLMKIPYRGTRTLIYATELISLHLLKNLFV